AKKAQWQSEKEVIDAIRALTEQLDDVKRQEEIAERQGDLGKVAELRYGRTAELQQQIAVQNTKLAEVQREGSYLNEEVTEEHIAKIVANWTGIPVDKMLEGELERLVHMEARLRERVI